MCALKGQLEVHLVAAWDRLFAYAGYQMPENFSPVDFRNPDYRQYPNFNSAHKYAKTLKEGDCLYVPAYWFQQLDSAKGEVAAVVFEYKVVFDFVGTVFQGLEQHLI